MNRPELQRHLDDMFGGNTPDDLLTPEEASYLDRNLHRLSSLDAIWDAMDDEWRQLEAGFAPHQSDAVNRFYQSPVWLLNGLFTEMDPVSTTHRRSIADFVAAQVASRISDFGGGFGSLSRILVERLPGAQVTIVEPFPSRLGKGLAAKYPNLCYAPELPKSADIVIAQDVLEHVLDPLADFARLLDGACDQGIVITANCFLPVILCHYPESFHLHFGFAWVVRPLGCEFLKCIPGAPHAHVFRKTGVPPDWQNARRREAFSKAIFPMLKQAQRVKRVLIGFRA